MAKETKSIIAECWNCGKTFQDKAIQGSWLAVTCPCPYCLVDCICGNTSNLQKSANPADFEARSGKWKESLSTMQSEQREQRLIKIAKLHSDISEDYDNGNFDEKMANHFLESSLADIKFLLREVGRLNKYIEELRKLAIAAQAPTDDRSL